MRFSSLLCIAMMMVVNTSASFVSSSSSSSEIDTTMVGTHVSRAVNTALHNFHSLQTTSTPTSGIFGDLTGVSTACKNANAIIENNSTVVTTQKTIVKGGCTDPGKPTCSTTSPKVCTCVQTFTNDVDYRSTVTSLGGQVCLLNMNLNINNAAAIFQYEGFLQLVPVSKSSTTCQDSDLKLFMNSAFDLLVGELRSGDKSITNIQSNITFCGVTQQVSKQFNAAYKNTQYGVAFIVAAIITFITTQ